jgi:beta-phosphoglucomutase-like phosphatase (HAD superfamily)
VLGLPDGITTCLFDLDGVLAQTANVHAEVLEAAGIEDLFEARIDGIVATREDGADVVVEDLSELLERHS